ncbi:MAG: hypothetical protein WAX07_04585 [Candidatus Altiarchaeia archaeon]|jgi:hypothetical protein
MEKKQKTPFPAITALPVLIIAGLAAAYIADGDEKRAGRKTGKMVNIRGGTGQLHGVTNISDLSLPENASKAQIREAARERIINQMGLPSNATDQQIINALKELEDENHAAIDAAISSKDYSSWKAAVEKSPLGTHLTYLIPLEKFPKYAEMVQAEKKAAALRIELDLSGMKAVRFMQRKSSDEL